MNFKKLGVGGEPLADDAAEWPIVLDERTELMWTVAEHEVDSYDEALELVKGLDAGGFTDWRLPAVEQLFALADRSRSNPAIDTAFFPNCHSDWYWSSTLWAPSPGDYAWIVNFDFGDATCNDRDFVGFVRAVRGGQSLAIGESA